MEKPMTQYIEIHWTSGSIDEARKVARYLVQEGHVACAQIIPWIESIYMWDNQLHTTQETKVILKTRDAKYDVVRDYIIANCKYEVPEITRVDIVDGNKEYLDWMAASTATA
jgi:periplasmic divalent cation tolerance protein